MVSGMAGGVGLVLCGAASVSQSLAGPSRATGWIITGVKWGNESSTPRTYGLDVGTTSALFARRF
jgi:hypothetical protein